MKLRQFACVSAPSNIAIIKYMGKKDAVLNIPSNASISMTLDSLSTYVELRQSDVLGNRWINQVPRVTVPSVAQSPKLSEVGIQRVERFLALLKRELPAVLAPWGWRVDTDCGWECCSVNTFPASVGIASSAAAFSAITLAASAVSVEAGQNFLEHYSKDLHLRTALARLSRLGSGSSCRSFFGPWVGWDDETPFLCSSQLPAYVDWVLLISDEAKSISSSQAHRLIESSPLNQGRPERANDRALRVRQALRDGHVQEIARVAWLEAWEMHSLFHTASEPFTYWKPGTIEILNWLRPYVFADDPPIVTLDAGPNVHLLVPATQSELWGERLRAQFPWLKCLKDTQGDGAKILEIGLA